MLVHCAAELTRDLILFRGWCCVLVHSGGALWLHISYQISSGLILLGGGAARWCIVVVL